MSMVLTSQAHRRCTPRTNRRIPAIPAGCFDGRIVHVSAVDTGPRKSESGLLTAEPGVSATGPPRPLSPAQGPRGYDSTPAPPRVGSSRSTPRGSGSTGQWLCVLHEDPTYPQYPQPSSSSTPPSRSASRRHRQPPQSPGRPPPTGPSNSSPLWQTHPTGVLRSHDIRNSQKS